MSCFVSRLLFLLLAVLVLVPSWAGDVQSRAREVNVEPGEERRPSAVQCHRRRQHKTPAEDAICRQIERVKQKILSQLGDDVRTALAPGSARLQLPQPLLHMYDVDIATGGAESATIDIDDAGRPNHDTQHESKYKQAKLIVFGHQSKYAGMTA